MIERDLRQLHATRETFAAALAPYGARTLTTYALGKGGAGSMPEVHPKMGYPVTPAGKQVPSGIP